MIPVTCSRPVWGLALALLLSACAAIPVNPDLPPPAHMAPAAPASNRPLIGLVLGSGAARGFAHIGVIQVLEAKGIVPDIIVGTSAGSLVGALYAGGNDGAALEKIALEMEESDVRDYIIPDRGLVRGHAIQAFTNRLLGYRTIEQLNRRFAAVATDLMTGETIAFNRGNTGMAVRASSSIPGLYQPVRIGGREYVDGGLVSPLPVRTARALGANIVIAVDVSRRPDGNLLIDSITGVLNQTIAIVGRLIAERESADADILIRPDVNGFPRFDFTQVKEVIQQGRIAAEADLPRVIEAIRDRQVR